MKFRTDYVTNSSSSSFICDICGENVSGWDLCLSEAEMIECVNGHVICEHEMLPVPRDKFIQEILDDQVKNAEWYDEVHTSEELHNMGDDDLLCAYFDIDDTRYNMPEECCPICQFIEYSEYDLSSYLLKEYGVSKDEVFAEVKQLNKRRKKLYNSEYITYVCKKFDLNPTEIVESWKEKFGSYREFSKWLNS